MNDQSGQPAPPPLTVLELPARVDRGEILRYAGMPGAGRGQLSLRLGVELESAVTWLLSRARPRGIYATHPITLEHDLVTFHGTAAPLSLRSADLARLLDGSQTATILAVTAGSEVDDEVVRLSAAGKLAQAAFLDAAGSDCVEQAADILCCMLGRSASRLGREVTERFSPGYGDLELAVQPAVAAAAHAGRIGIQVQASLMMLPLKSVTAIVGSRPAKADSRPGGPPGDTGDAKCARCQVRECRYRLDSDVEKVDQR